MKKAFLVGFSVMARVVVNVPGGFCPSKDPDSPFIDDIIEAAVSKIGGDFGNYVNGDNCELVEEDIECPHVKMKGCSKTRKMTSRLARALDLVDNVINNTYKKNTTNYKNLKKTYKNMTIKVGTTIRINHLKGENGTYDGRTGVVGHIDDMGQLHGSWGGIAVIPEDDDFTVLSYPEKRTLSFRGKRVLFSPWLKGYPVGGTEPVIYLPELHNSFHVLPETVGQCSGLKDMNGTDIYEDDVLFCSKNQVSVKVSWNDEMAAFICLKRKNIVCGYLSEFISNSVVVGNVIDNPDIWNTKKDCHETEQD